MRPEISIAFAAGSATEHERGIDKNYNIIEYTPIYWILSIFSNALGSRIGASDHSSGDAAGPNYRMTRARCVAPSVFLSGSG
jgi:hypothetical protein